MGTGAKPLKTRETEPLTRIERNLLRALQADGRLSNAELAQRINVSPATCHRRTQRLIEEGYITGGRWWTRRR